MKLDNARLLCAKSPEEVSSALLRASDFFKCMHPEDMLTLSSYIYRAILHQSNLIKIRFATGNSYFRPECWPKYTIFRSGNLIWALLLEMELNQKKKLKSIQLKNPVSPMYEKYIEKYLVANKTKSEIMQAWAQIRISSNTPSSCDI